MHSSTTKTSDTTSVSYRLPTPPPLRPALPLPLPLPPPPRPPAAPKSRRAELKKGLKMSSNFTVTRLVRWRVKDFAACFFACRVPLDKETRDSSNVTSKRPNRSTVYKDSQRSNTEHGSRRKMAIVKKLQDSRSSSRNKTNGASVSPEANHGISSTDAEWLHFSEEEYIVFCFREDGEIDMINEGHPSEAVLEIDSDQIPTLMPLHRQVDGERGNEQDSNLPPHEVKKIKPVAEGSSTATKMDSFESCDSNLSDGSTSSFAFPVLGKEWIGSPVQMPKTDKHRSTSVHLNCCRF